MNIISLDFETYYTTQYSLSKMTTQEYILDPRFEVIGVGVTKEDGYRYWKTGSHREIALYLNNLCDWDKVALLAQNCMFDAAILAWHFGIRPGKLLDTLAMSRALFPHEKSHSLKAQAERMGIGEKGTAVLDYKGYQRKAFSPAELGLYGDYCLNDCDLALSLAQLYIPHMPVPELKLIDSTLRIYTEPRLVVDKQALQAHLEQVRLNKAMTLERVRECLQTPEASDDDLKGLLASSNKFASALESMGVAPPMKISPTTGKETYAFAKTDEAFKALEDHEDEAVQALVAARLGTKSTIEETRTQRLIDCANLSEELPIALRFFGAWTGRWSGDSAGATNFQNLPRKSLMKEAVLAPEGTVLCGGDLSNIELRLGLWLAGQTDKVDLIRNGLDLYKDLAAKTNGVPYDEVPPDMRQTFKVVNLSAIYATGAARLQNTLRVMANQRVPLDRAKAMIDLYRSENPHVVDTWQECHEVLLAVAEKSKTVPSLFGGLVSWDAERHGLLLPSGLHLQMPNLRIEYSEMGKKEFVFDGKNGTERTYGGKLFQGLTQALARCIIAVGWRRIEKRTKVVLSVHDSLYWLAPEAQAERALLWGLQQMVKPVSWCEDLPLGAEGEFGKSLKGGSKKYVV